MNTLIIYKSYHHMNTEKIAKEMADVLNARLVKVDDAQQVDLNEYDLIGFGSGIYADIPHKTLIKFIEEMPVMDKNVFVFSTSGSILDRHHDLITEKLMEKGCNIVGDFHCLGEVKVMGVNMNIKGPMGWLLGKNKGHPDDEDFKRAREFASTLLNE